MRIFNIFYLIIFTLLLGVYLFLDYGDCRNKAFEKVLKKVGSKKDKKVFKIIQSNIHKSKLFLQLAYYFSLIPLSLVNRDNLNFLLLFILFTTIILLVPQLRNLITNIAIFLLREKNIRRLLLRGLK
jgi:hypothetical protein